MWKYPHLKELLLQRSKLRIVGVQLWNRVSQKIQDWEGQKSWLATIGNKEVGKTSKKLSRNKHPGHLWNKNLGVLSKIKNFFNLCHTNIVPHVESGLQNTFERPRKGSYAWPDIEKLIPDESSMDEFGWINWSWMKVWCRMNWSWMKDQWMHCGRIKQLKI